MMSKKNKIFDLSTQQTDLSGKIVVGLERISSAFRFLLWEKSKEFGLSPIQIQILIFIEYHGETQCGVSYLAKEFNLTKATISDAVKSLEGKKMVVKTKGIVDSRSHVISLTPEGKKIVKSIESFANPVKEKVDSFSEEDRDSLFQNIVKIVHKLNQSDVISIQRMCFSCKFYTNEKEKHFCNLINAQLRNQDLRLDCPEFEKRA